MSTACSDPGAAGHRDLLERIGWLDVETSTEIMQGVYGFDVVLQDDAQKFAAYGNDGANAQTLDGGDTWDPLTDIGSANIYGGVAWEGRRVLVGQGGAIWMKDLDGNPDFDCGPLGGSGDRDQTTWHAPCVKPSSLPDLGEVARYETSRFVAVGLGGKVVATAPDGSDPHPYHSDLLMEDWDDISPSSSLFDDAWHTDLTPDLFDIARVADGVVAVGAEGTVIARAPGATTWKLLDLGSGTHEWTLRGVAVDDVNEYVEVASSGTEWTHHKVCSVVVVGDNGKSAWFRFDWADFSETAFGASDITLFDGTSAWGTADLKNVTVDERSRIVVGTNNTIRAMPREEEWDNAPAWIDLNPPGSYTEEFHDVASDGRYIVAVGKRYATPNVGVAWSGTEEVLECFIRVTPVPADGADGDTDADDLLEITADMGDLEPSAHCDPGAGSSSVSVVGLVQPVFMGDDPKRDRVIITRNTAVSLPDVEFSTELTGAAGSPTDITDLPAIAWRVNLVENDGGDLRHFRVTLVAEERFPFADLAGWRRTGVFPAGPISAYPLGDIPYPDYDDVSDPLFVDLIYGVYADESSNDFIEAQDILASEDEDLCGVSDALIAWVPWTECTTDGTDCDEAPFPARDPDATPHTEVVDAFLGFTRFRSGVGHPFIDFADAQDDGMAWRIPTMKQYFNPRCALVEFEDGSGGSCVEVAGVDCTDPDLFAGWVAECCSAAVDAEELHLPEVRRIPLYAPVDGYAFRIPVLAGGVLKPSRRQGASGEADDCAMIYDDEECEEEGGCWRDGVTPLDLVDAIFVMRTDGKVIFRIDHVESCLFDPDQLPSLEIPAVDDPVPVEAGDRIGMAINFKQFDVAVYIRDERGGWRVISYFDILPDGLYNLYRQQFDVGDRNSDPGESGHGAEDDPIISLEDRDECPLFPGNPGVDGLYMVDFIEQQLAINPTTSDPYCDDNGAQTVKNNHIFIH